MQTQSDSIEKIRREHIYISERDVRGKRKSIVNHEGVHNLNS
jgi:hypothetical protein